MLATEVKIACCELRGDRLAPSGGWRGGARRARGPGRRDHRGGRHRRTGERVVAIGTGRRATRGSPAEERESPRAARRSAPPRGSALTVCSRAEGSARGGLGEPGRRGARRQPGRRRRPRGQSWPAWSARTARRGVPDAATAASRSSDRGASKNAGSTSGSSGALSSASAYSIAEPSSAIDGNRSSGALARQRCTSSSISAGTSSRSELASGGCSVRVRLDHLADGLALERRLPGQHLEQDAAEAIDVRARIAAPAAAALLRRHIDGRADHRLRGRGGVGRLEDRAECRIEDLRALAALRLAVADQEDVLGLQIAVHDALGVRGGERARDLPRDP